MAVNLAHRAGRHQVSLARALSKIGLSSRSQARILIGQGNVTVNGKVVRHPDTWVDLRTDRIAVDGRAATREDHVYFALNKPPGYVTTRSDELGRKTVYDLLPPNSRWIFPVGRLDKDTAGLLLFTNDTRFGELVTSPNASLPKRYRVRADRPLRREDRRIMESGMELPDGARLLPASVTASREENTVFDIAIVEGKNRQIRRMCEALGYRVIALTRLSIGGIQLGDLPAGKTRPLREEEIAAVLTPGA